MLPEVQILLLSLTWGVNVNILMLEMVKALIIIHRAILLVEMDIIKENVSRRDRNLKLLEALGLNFEGQPILMFGNWTSFHICHRLTNHALFHGVFNLNSLF